MSAARRKGTAAESAVVTFLRTAGFRHAERRALNGAVDLGDITGVPGVVFEVKNHRTYQLPAWLRETTIERDNAHADVGVLVVKPNGVGDSRTGEWWAVLTLEDCARLLVDAGYGARS